MKKLILILFVLMSALAYSYPPRVNMVDIEEVFYGEYYLSDSTSVDSIYTKKFTTFADSVSFVAEIIEADSMEVTNGLPLIQVTGGIQYFSPSGLTDTTAIANLTQVVNLTTGIAWFGSTFKQISSKKTNRARLVLKVENKNAGSQHFKIKIFAIKEWSK